MVVLNIFNLDDAENANVIASLSNGTHVIGRGDLLNVKDKRVSRKHAVIVVDDDNITLTSSHVNPCFFQAAEGKILTIINKDNTNEIGDGDRFGLLPDSLWFKVKIDRTLNNDDHISEQEVENRLVPAADITIDQVDDCDRIESGLKRHTTEDLNDDGHESVKKVKLSNGDASTSKSTDEYQNQVDKEPTNLEMNEIASSQLSQAESLNLQLDEDDISDEKTSQKDKSSDAINDNETSHNNTSHLDEELIHFNETANVADLDNASPKEEVCGTSDTEGRIEANEIKQENVSFADLQPPVSTSQNLPNEEIKEEPQDDNGAHSSGNNIDNSASDNGKKKLRRERCWYADRCFRKNPHHRETFSHPGDEDYSSDPEDDRPDCPFGAACYRRNIEHRQEYKHLNRPAPKPTAPQTPPNKKRQPRPKRDDNSTDDDEDDDLQSDSLPSNDSQPVKQRLRKKAGKKVKLLDTPEDDYDYEDPFIDDGSSDEFRYDEDVDDSDDTDWNDSQEVEEDRKEQKRLLKEAKKFKNTK